jgi:hypothetical protein
MNKGMNWGVFKGLYNGYGIYWNGSYNVEGSGDYRTIKDAQTVIDSDVAESRILEAAKRKAKAESGKYLVAIMQDDDSVVVKTPAGYRKFEDRRRLRNAIADLEDEFDMEFMWLN